MAHSGCRRKKPGIADWLRIIGVGFCSVLFGPAFHGHAGYAIPSEAKGTQFAQASASAPDLFSQNTSQGTEPAQAGSSTPGIDPTPAGETQNPPEPPATSSPWSINGFYQAEAAYTVASPDHWSKLRNTFELGVQRNLTDEVELKVSGRFWYDAVYDVTTFFPGSVKRNARFEAMFRETYLDAGAGDWDFRVGRQHIIWGEVVGLFFADVVSARDLRENILPEFGFLRIPQWATRVEYFKDDFKAEAIWIPYMTYDEIGKPGSDFYPFVVSLPSGFARKIRRERRPQGLENSAGGVRLSYLASGWDLSTFYYTSLDSSPAFFRRISVAPTPTVFFRPDHDRIHQAGATMSKDLGTFVLRGEAIYTWDRWFNVTRVNDSDGVVRQNFLDYILGVEFPLPMESRLNLQFFQRVFTSHDRDIIPRKIENGASLLVSTKLFNEKVEPELLTIHSLNRLDWLARFKVSWNFHENWRLVVGTAFFGGPRLGLWGRFDKSDRVFTELRFSF
ncbi:MAG: DUF1302 family protein [Candidatus Binatia bacterium]